MCTLGDKKVGKREKRRAGRSRAGRRVWREEESESAVIGTWHPVQELSAFPLRDPRTPESCELRGRADIVKRSPGTSVE